MAITEATPYQCGICREGFTKPEYAARCQAQGVPPLAFYCHDVLALPAHHGRTVTRELLVLHSHRVHHAVGVKCPVNGPCEHAVTYTSYQLVPSWWQGARAWVAPTDRSEPWYDRNVNYLKGYRRVATLADDWGQVTEDEDPARYMAGPYPLEEWAALWELHDQHAYRRRSRPVGRGLFQMPMWDDPRRCPMQVNPASRARLAGVAQRLSTLATYQLEFRHLSVAHPTAHIAKRFPLGYLQGACGMSFHSSQSVPAQDGAPLCDRCQRWFKARI